MSGFIKYLDNKFYPEFNSNWDDSIFRKYILDELKPHHRVLDIGAGAGIVEQMNFKGKAGTIVGIDLDERVLENPWIDEAHHGDASSTPFSDGEFDVIICDNVLEHIAEPKAFLKEVSRILKPGGLFLGKTPNKFHYMPLIARFTPLWFHKFYNNLRGRQTDDTFPTTYLLNTKKDVERHAEECQLELENSYLIEGRPEYLRILSITYLFGILYQRLVSKISFLKRFSVLFIVTLRSTKEK